MAKVQEAEIIDLDSDDDVTPIEQEKKKTCTINCINFKCNSGVDMRPAPSFACAFYGVNMTKKKKKRHICKICLDTALDHQDKLINAILDHKPLMQCEFPDHTMEVEISDSDESDDEKVDIEETVYEEDWEEFSKRLDKTLIDVMVKYDINYQLEQAESELKAEFDSIDKTNTKLDNDLTKTMNRLDNLRTMIYDEFKPTYHMVKELQIEDPPPLPPAPAPTPVQTITVQHSPVQNRPVHYQTTPPAQHIPARNIPRQVENTNYHPVATKKVTQGRVLAKPPPQQDSQPEILLQEDGRDIRQKVDLPPYGPLIKPPPSVDDYVFTMKHPLFPWVKGKVTQVISSKPMNIQCRVKLLQKKYAGQVKTYTGKQMAASSPSMTLIPVGTRVVAIFHDIHTSNYYSGVVAEPPKATNKYRYLIFFDDGYAQYVKHKNIYLVHESSSRVWEDIPAESRDFVKKYMESYPERPMVKLQKDQVVKTEWNGKWWVARVREVDASLVHMHFDADNRTEWIYRGSARLAPLYLELMKANLRQQGCHSSLNTPRHRGAAIANKNGPYVEYTSTARDDTDKTKSATPVQDVAAPTPAPAVPQQSRAVAKKSTANKRPPAPEPTPSIYNANMETKSSHSIVYYQTQNKIQTRKFYPHRCSHRCVENISFTPDDLKGYSPLSIPLLCGWNRQLSKFPKTKKVILYQAPCGLRLRNMEELHAYLRITKCPMSVDLFEFDFWVHCLAEFVLDKCFVNIKDLSYGVENVPIPCVNEIDHAYPDTIKYTTKREPSEDVHMNLDAEFLVCCDCTDDCANKSKCQCWQLTIQGATLGGRVANAAVGYQYKRLPEAVTTGIYECNSRCKCSVKTCLNRVVQHPLNLKLQVFKTAPRGWGIRCLNDIPLGSFICIYAGRLLTEQGANEGGKNYGDEYLAELDYVEVVENMKEGYEEEALDSDNDLPYEDPVNDKQDKKAEEETETRKSGITSRYDSDDDFNIGKKFQKTVNIDDDDDSTQSIRSRLRKRNKKDENQGSDKSEDGHSKDGQDKAGSDDEEEIREPSKLDVAVDTAEIDKEKCTSVRDFFGEDEAVYIMDAKTTGNIGRYLNHSCDPNVFVQNVFVDTHDVRFPWVAFFALSYIRAGQELTWNYSYDVGSIPGKVIICKCGASNCRGRLL